MFCRTRSVVVTMLAEVVVGGLGLRPGRVGDAGLLPGRVVGVGPDRAARVGLAGQVAELVVGRSVVVLPSGSVIAGLPAPALL